MIKIDRQTGFKKQVKDNKMRIDLTIGLFGFGVVGGGLHEVLNRSKLLNASIKSIVVKDPTKKRSIESRYFSYDKGVILNDPEINVVVELINDSEAAYAIVTEALKKGKHVVTANKKLIAEHLDELINLSRQNNVSLLYEAAVAGSIPILRNLEEYYNNDTLSSVQGIVNGTSNYILTQSNKGIAYQEALKQAQELGFAEADPTLDVEGFDSKFKLILLIKHAFGISTTPDQVFNIGITKIHERDVRYALEKGLRIKLLARAEKIGDQVIGFVAPHFVSSEQPAYGVNNEFNAVSVNALFSDRQVFYGKGAGSYPTASAVLSDISALQFEYRYEYRKSGNDQVSFSDDFKLKIYASSTDENILKSLPFIETDEFYKSADFSYSTGWIAFNELRRSIDRSATDLSIVIVDEPLRAAGTESLYLEKNKTTFVAV
jgi:homoserine dehydrogenase